MPVHEQTYFHIYPLVSQKETNNKVKQKAIYVMYVLRGHMGWGKYCLDSFSHRTFKSINQSITCRLGENTILPKLFLRKIDYSWSHHPILRPEWTLRKVFTNIESWCTVVCSTRSNIHQKLKMNEIAYNSNLNLN